MKINNLLLLALVFSIVVIFAVIAVNGLAIDCNEIARTIGGNCLR